MYTRDGMPCTTEYCFFHARPLPNAPFAITTTNDDIDNEHAGKNTPAKSSPHRPSGRARARDLYGNLNLFIHAIIGFRGQPETLHVQPYELERVRVSL